MNKMSYNRNSLIDKCFIIIPVSHHNDHTSLIACISGQKNFAAASATLNLVPDDFVVERNLQLL